MELRPYRDADVEAVVSLWNSSVKGCYATGPLTEERFLSDVAGKCYFEPDGLILAFERGRPVAFAHAGFKSTDWIAPDRRSGTVSMAAVESGHMEAGEAAVAQAIRYLLKRGAKQVEAFTIDFASTPFYNGLYGGEKAGMDEAHPGGWEVLGRCGFRVHYGTVIMTADLTEDTEPLSEFNGMQVRTGPWNSPIAGRDPSQCYGIPENVQRTGLIGSDGNEKAGVSFWHLDRYNESTGERLAVVSHVGSAEELWGTGASLAVQREVHRIVKSEGATRVGLGTGGSNGRAVSFYRKLGYEVIKSAAVFFLDWRRYGDYR